MSLARLGDARARGVVVGAAAGAQGVLDPLELSGAQRTVDKACAVGGVHADADDARCDLERVVADTGVAGVGGESVPDRAGAGVRGIKMCGDELLRCERGTSRVGGDLARGRREGGQDSGNRARIELGGDVDLLGLFRGAP